MSGFFRDYTFDVLFRTLDADALNHLLLTNNIANVNTPGYHRMEVAFKQALKEALEEKPGDSDALARVKPEIVVDDSSVMRADQNNVDIDKEMAKLAANSIEYSAAAQLVSRRFAMLQSVIGG